MNFIHRVFHLLRRTGNLPAPGRVREPVFDKAFGIAALHIFVLGSLAIAQPMLNLLGQYPEFFAARRAEPLEVLFFVVFLVAGVPIPLLLLEMAASLFGKRPRLWTHLFLVAALVSTILLPVTRRLWDGPGVTMVSIAGLLGVASAFCYVRFAPLRLFVTVLTPILLISPTLFLMNDRIQELVLPQPSIALFPDSVVAKNPVPIVFVVFDELSLSTLLDGHGKIDRTVFPNFGMFADGSHWFRNATTVSDTTGMAVGAMLSGRFSETKRTPTVRAYPDNLFTLLQGRYHMNVRENRTHLCPDLVCPGPAVPFGERMRSLLIDGAVVFLHLEAPSDFSAALPTISQDWADFVAKPRSARQGPGELFRRLIASFEAGGPPRLDYLHVHFPHVPYRYLPDGKKYRDTGIPGLSKERWGNDGWAVNQALQRYLFQTAFADKLLGDLLDGLRQKGLYDSSLIIVAADHGVSFQRSGLRRPVAASNFYEILPVPLFFKLPGQRKGVISDQNAESVDILPTIADVLGIDLPFATDGSSLLDSRRQERKRKQVFRHWSRKTLYFASTIEEKAKTKRKMDSLFPTKGGPERWYRMGENTELLNRRPEEIGPIGPAAGMAQLLGATVAEFRDYEPGGIYTPSHITGELTLREGVVPPNDLAIAVNGTVRAVTRTLRRKRGRLRFSAFVAPRFFRAGRNDVAVYVILKKPDGSVALMPTAQPGMPVGRPSATYKLITKDEREIIQGPDAFRVEVEAGQLDGWLDTRKNGKGWMRLGGWSFDPKGKRPAKTLFLFVDGKFVTAATTGKERPDVATAMGNEARKSGFSIYLGDSLAGDGCVPRVRLFALSERGVASELKYNPAFRCDR